MSLSDYYFLSLKNSKDLDNVNLDSSFDEIYKKCIDIFMQNVPFERTEDNLLSDSEEGRRLFLIENNPDRVYEGVLWDDDRIRHISRSDYVYTVPAWDWWIEGYLPRRKYRSNSNSMMLTEEISSNDSDDIKRILKYEDYNLRECRNLGCDNVDLPYQVDNFRKTLLSLWPLKNALGYSRFNEAIRKEVPRDIFFILRGGRFISELVNTSDSDLSNHEVYFLNKNQLGNEDFKGNSCLIVDECIGSGSMLERVLQSTDYSEYSFLSFDATLPREIYRKKFSSVNFYIPENCLNIYGSRLFEENPVMIGTKGLPNYEEGDLGVRQKLKNSILTKAKNKNYDNIKEEVELKINELTLK